MKKKYQVTNGAGKRQVIMAPSPADALEASGVIGEFELRVWENGFWREVCTCEINEEDE